MQATPPPRDGELQKPTPTSEPSDGLGPRQPASWWFFGVVAAFGAISDLWSKHWAAGVLTNWDYKKSTQQTYDVIPGWFDLQFAQNPGGAWSMLKNLPEVYRRPFFLIVSTAASVFIAHVYSRIDRRDWSMRWGLPLALGGAIGNLVDRIRHGWVVDFLHFYVDRGEKTFHWPTFNVADVWIVAGVALMAMSLFTGKSRLGVFDEELEAASERELALRARRAREGGLD